MSAQFIIGIDEAGRGPLAGPVLVGAVRADAHFLATLPLDRDSKKLTDNSRRRWYERIQTEAEAGNLTFSFVAGSHEQIDQTGIVSSLAWAVDQALNQLSADRTTDQVLLDGNLFAPKNFLKQQTIVRGDESQRAIALASVVAKVVRDDLMIKLAETYPEYGFAGHKGYATEEHYLALLRYGRCPIHRQSYTRFLD